MDLLCGDSPNVRRLTTCMQSLSFLSKITKATRFPPISVNNVDGRLSRSASPSLIDHMWSNNLSECDSGVLMYDLTDH